MFKANHVHLFILNFFLQDIFTKMDTKQLFEALMSHKLTRKIFDGIYSIDTLEDITRRPKFIICNTDPSHKPGKHWVAFYFMDKETVFFFDSLGKNISDYGKKFVDFVKRYAHQACVKLVET